MIRSLILFISLLAVSACNKNMYVSDANTHRVPVLLKRYLNGASDKPTEPVVKNLTQPFTLSDPFWLIPSEYLPAGVAARRSNNNVSIAIYHQRIYVAFRTGKNHFASSKTGMYVISSADGTHWDEELQVFNGKDVREPLLTVINDTLFFYHFTAGTNMFRFEPQGISAYRKYNNQPWLPPVLISSGNEVQWNIKEHNGTYYRSSYSGSHYQLKGPATVRLNFTTSKNGLDWQPVGDSATVYFGGVSEADFEWDQDDNLWAMGRLEDGDETGFGSHLFFASKNDWSKWEHSDTACRTAFMSPKMLRHGNDLYLIARRQLGRKEFGHAPKHKPMHKQRLTNWIRYSLSPKTTALYRINTNTQKAEHLADLPGAGDTAFPSIWPLDEHTFLIANYTSPPHRTKRTWLGGQLRPTMIYLQLLEF